MDKTLHDQGFYAFGSFQLDPRQRRLTHDGDLVAITPTVFDMLLHLVENPDRIVTKDELLAAVWPDRTVGESSLSHTIFVLRRALNSAGDQERFIVTAPGRGYRFVMSVRRELGAPAPVRQPLEPLASVPKPAGRRPRLWRSPAVRWAEGGAALLAIVVAGISTLWPWRAPTPAAVAPKVLVLAEFQNLTGDPIFDKTLGKALAIDLDQSPFLTVLPDQKVQDTLVLMTRSKDELLTPTLAQEVCARNNGRAVLGGSIASMGAQYLLTLTATDCTGAEVFAAEKAQVDRREALIPAIDRLGGKLRERLGESSGSIHRFDAPLLPERTASLEALKAFSEATWLNDHGRRAESVPLFQHAIAIDPNFAASYEALSFIFERMREANLDVAYARKAYDLRDTVGEREKFEILARYHQSVTGNYPDTIRDLQAWSETYPEDPKPWAIIAHEHYSMKQLQPTMTAAKRLFALDPNKEISYVLLADAYMLRGDERKAREICEAAVAKGLAGEEVHLLLLRIALSAGDQAGVAAQLDWAKGRPVEPMALARVGFLACGRGQVRQGEEIFAKELALERAEGRDNAYAALWTRCLADVGLGATALKRLDTLPGNKDDYNYVYTTAEVGNVARAEAILARRLKDRPADTMLNGDFAPELRAQIALRRGEPDVALTALRGALPYDRDVPYHQAEAYLAKGDGRSAALEFLRFQALIFHGPSNWYLSLSDLGLARAYRLAGNISASRQYYRAFFSDWKDADSDLPVLKAAKAEYAKL